MSVVKNSSCKTCGSAVSKFVLKCPDCGRPNPTYNFVTFSVCWVILLLISVMLAIGANKWFWLLSALIIIGVIDFALNVLRSKSNHLKLSSGILNGYNFSTDKSLSISNHLDDFKDNLSIIWAGNPYEIEFSYRNGNGDRSRRKLTLEEISVSKDFTPYFIGKCHTNDDVRCFRMDRITSKIKYKSKLYDVVEFIDVVMDLDFELVKKIDEIIDESKL